MSEDNKLAPETPADVLHAHVQNHIQLPETQKFDNESLIDEVTAHPNLQPHSITDMYNHMMAHNSASQLPATGEADTGNMSNTSTENLLTHPNAPKEIKADFIGKTYHPDNVHSSLHEKLADEGHVPEAHLRNMSEAVLGMGKTPYAYKQIAPDYFLGHFKKRSQQDPEGLDEAQQQAHEREGKLGFEGLINSTKHTPESLDQTIQAFMDNKHVKHRYEKDNNRLLQELVDGREDLSKDQLNRIHQYAEANKDESGYRHNDAIESILKHKNVDPALLAKYATGKDVRDEALEHPNLPKESINAFVKRVKDPNGWSEKRQVQSILSNPNITKAHVKALIAKGSVDALHHDLADEADVRDFYNKSKKGTEDARSILSAKRVPPDVLKEIVNHKNQDVAVQALKHPNADMDVVQEGLKRKAKFVQDEARLHPLVAGQQVREGLHSGKVSLTKVYKDQDYKEHFDKMTPADQEKVFTAAHDKYKGYDLADIAKKSKERPENIIYNKYKLASDPRAPKVIREQHGKDLADIFSDKIPKNSEPNENTHLDILSDDHKSDNGRIIRAVSGLAQQGNKDAQRAFLDNPAVLQSAKRHVNLDEAPSDFLEAMYKKSNDYQRNGTTVFDHSGRPEQFDKGATLLEPLFSAKNLPENVFHEIASNKDMMEKIGQGDQFKRYNDLPEDEQNAKYGPILASGSKEAAKSILKAKAPPASWNAAFDMLSPQEKGSFIHSNMNHIQSHRPDIFKNTALGVYNEDARQGSAVQVKAIGQMKADSPEDNDTIKKIISTPDGMTGSMPDKDIAQYIPEKMASKDFSIADHAFAAGRPDLGYSLVSKKLKSDVSKLDRVSSYDPPEEQQAAREGAAHAISEMSQKVETIPMLDTESDNPIASKWNELLERSKGDQYYNQSYFKDLIEKGANLDFLADMPGQAGKRLKETALRNNLISKDKLQQIAASGTIDDIINIGEGKKKMEMLGAFLQKPDIKPEELEKLANSMNHSFINPDAHEYGRRQTMSDKAYEHYSSNLNRLVDLYAEKAPHAMGTMIKNAIKAPGRGDELTQKDKDNIKTDLTKHIYGKTYPTDQAKNQSMYQMYKGLKANDMDPHNLKMYLEKGVIKSNDIDTMVQMAEDRNLSENGMAILSKLASKPETMSAEQIASLSTTLSYDSAPESVIGFAKSFEKKMSEAQMTKPGSNLAPVKAKFLKSLTNTFNPRSGDDGHKAKNEFVINYNKKAALDPATAPMANSNLLSMSAQVANHDLDKALDMYTQLPDDATKFDSDKAFYTEVPEDMLNHPRFIENSTSGWKLQKLASNAENLTGANASILTSRVLSEAGATINKTHVMQNFENNAFVQSEDSIKLARSMSENDFNKFVKEQGQANSMDGNIIFAAHARLQDLENVVKDPNLASPGAPFMGDEHRNKIAYNMHALSHAIKNAKFSEDAALLKDKLVTVSSMISKIHEHSMHLATSMMADINRTGYNIEIGRDAGYILSTADNLASTGLALDKEDSLKVMELASAHRRIQQAAGIKGNDSDSYEVIGKVVEKAENLEEQDWKQTFTSEPHAVFNLSKRDKIPTEALKSVDFGLYENHVSEEPEGHGRTTQDVFAKETAKWFPKMSKEDLSHHGKNLMGMYVRMANDNKISSNSYREAMSQAMKYAGSSLEHKDVMNLLDNTKNHDIRNSIFKDAVANGVGGENTLKQYVKEFGSEMFKTVKGLGRYEGDNLAHKLEPVLKSPHISDDIGSKVIDMFKENPEAMKQSTLMLLKNKSTPSQSVNAIADHLMKNHENGYKDIDNRLSADIAIELMQHPNMDEENLVNMFNVSNEKYPKFFASSGKFNPALTNPTHGGKLFRSMPIEVPSDVPGVETASAVRNVSLQHKAYKRMQEVMNLIPAEGISWAEFKRKHPAEEKTLPQEIKAVFLAGNNKPVMPEDFAKGLRNLDDASKKYHLTYSHWTSHLQKHRKDSKPNLVVQVNNSEESEKALSQDPKLWSLYQKLLTETNGISGDTIGLHPTTPHLVSWSRVDTDQGGDAWVIEEHQSDFAQKFRRNIKTILKNFPSGTKINGHHITAEEMAGYAKQIDRHLEDWSEASIQAVIDNAKAHGVKKLFMHGPELRSHMSGGTSKFEYNRESWDNKNTRGQMSGFRKIYEETPAKHGFKECDYTDYPRHSTDTLNQVKKKNLSTKCWSLDLTPDQRPKKARKKA